MVEEARVEAQVHGGWSREGQKMKLWNYEYTALVNNNYSRCEEKARYVFSKYSKLQIEKFRRLFTPFGCLQQSTQDDLFSLLSLIADGAFSVKLHRPFSSCDG